MRDPKIFRDTFSYHPVYRSFDIESEQPGLNYYEYGPQNSRGFRALKVWLALRQVGRVGYQEMMSDDIRLARALFEIAQTHPELEALPGIVSRIGKEVDAEKRPAELQREAAP